MLVHRRGIEATMDSQVLNYLFMAVQGRQVHKRRPAGCRVASIAVVPLNEATQQRQPTKARRKVDWRALCAFGIAIVGIGTNSNELLHDVDIPLCASFCQSPLKSFLSHPVSRARIDADPGTRLSHGHVGFSLAVSAALHAVVATSVSAPRATRSSYKVCDQVFSKCGKGLSIA